MLIKKTILLLAVSTLVLIPELAKAATIDINSDGNRVIVGEDGNVYIHNQQTRDDINTYYDRDGGIRRWRNWGVYRFHRGNCERHSYSYYTSRSNSYSSTTVCQ